MTVTYVVWTDYFVGFVVASQKVCQSLSQLQNASGVIVVLLPVCQSECLVHLSKHLLLHELVD